MGTDDTFVLPASFAQRRLWFLDQLQPGSSAYHMCGAFRLSGPLNVPAWAQSVNEVARRHEALRTTFDVVGGEPVQVIAPAAAIDVPVIDLQTWPDARREDEVRRLATEEVRRPFDLRTGPLLRCTLLRLSEEEHVLILVVHHIVFDGWSGTILTRELSALYDAFRAGKPSPLSELPIQYADFAVWERGRLQGEVLQEHLAYWERQLAGAGALELPADRPRPTVQSHAGASLALELPGTLVEALTVLGRREGATLFMTLLAAFQVLLYRYAGQQDVIVGCPVANRNAAEVEGLIGFFVNMLAIRTSLAGNPTFSELLRRVREACVEAYARQDLPFEKVVEALRLERDLSRPPLFQVTFGLQNAPGLAAGETLRLSGLTASAARLGPETVRFDMECSLREGPGGLTGALTYNTELFDASTVARMAEHYRRLLVGIAADPAQRVAELPLLAETERLQILETWNDTRTDYPRDRCIHELFEEQAGREPDAVALAFGEEQWTYRDLNARANQLARYLRSLGVGLEAPVGLCLERSPQMVTTMLGILKAGGAYVPLAPEYPRERLAFMLEDTGAPVIVTEERLLEALPAFQGEVVCLDRDWPAIARLAQDHPLNLSRAADLAYVMYTSGSTGAPKGVAVPHRAVVRLVCGADYVALRPGDRVAQVSTATFDAATFEIWGALLNGACLVGIPRDVALSPRDFAETIRKERIDTLFLTTALFNQVAAAAPGAFEPVRDLLFGGEAVEPRWVREVLASGRPRRLLHVYGPTEGTTFTSWHLVDRVEESARTVPIGRPVANTRIYLLDETLRPVPAGVPGELCVGGDGLARGYLRRPEMTAEAFVPNPFGNEPGARLYRTGDLARYLPDGSIEFLGRRDHQVKLRGYRIELGEIEAALGQYPSVREAAVLLREDAPGDRRLAAYVVPRPGTKPEGDDLRHYLQGKLPDYMVPAAFVILDALPLNASGKVDRRALPPPGRASGRPGEVAAPRDILDLRLARMWESILGVSPVGPNDSFFDLGGHSLLAIRLFARIEEGFGVRLPISTLFRAPTVGQLAEEIRQGGDPSDWTMVVPMQPEGSRPPFFCVHSFSGEVLEYAELARRLGPDQPVYGLRALAASQRQAPSGATARIEDMAACYVKAMRAVQPAGPYYLGGYCYGAVIAFEMARQLRESGEQVGLLALFEAATRKGTDGEGQWRRLRAGAGFARNLPVWLRDNLSQRRDALWKRTLVRARAQARATWREVSGRRQGTADSQALLEDFLGDTSYLPDWARAVRAAHLEALRRYHPRVYDGRVTLFRVRALPLTLAYDPTLGWGELAAGGVEIVIVEGSHDNLLREPYVQSLAAELRDCLERAQAQAAGAVPGQARAH